MTAWLSSQGRSARSGYSSTTRRHRSGTLRHLWGLDMFDTQERHLEGSRRPAPQDADPGDRAGRGEPDAQPRASCTAPQRARARAALGAVWGSKNLKAIAVRGTGGVKVGNPERLMKIAKEAPPLDLPARSAPGEVEKSCLVPPRRLVVLPRRRGQRLGVASRRRPPRPRRASAAPSAVTSSSRFRTARAATTAGKCNQMSWYRAQCGDPVRRDHGHLLAGDGRSATPSA
jgi:hypothetical protein